MDLNYSQDDEITYKTDQFTIDINVISTLIASLPRLSISGLISELRFYIWKNIMVIHYSKEFRSLLLKTVTLKDKVVGGSTAI